MTSNQATSIRTGVERAAADLSGVTLGLSIWEGRGDWSAWPEQARRESAARALAELGAAIEALTGWRDALSNALGAASADDSGEQYADGPDDSPTDPAAVEHALRIARAYTGRTDTERTEQ